MTLVIDAKPDGGWPYPWADDIFLTDFTYAWFDDQLHITCYHSGFVPASRIIEDPGWQWPNEDDLTMLNVPSGLKYDCSQPDSIILVSVPHRQ